MRCQEMTGHFSEKTEESVMQLTSFPLRSSFFVVHRAHSSIHNRESETNFHPLFNCKRGIPLVILFIKDLERRGKMKTIDLHLAMTVLIIFSLLIFSGCYVHFGFSDDYPYREYNPGPDPLPPPPPPVYTPPSGSGSETAATPSNAHRESGYQRPSVSQQNTEQRTESTPARNTAVTTPAPSSSGSQADDGSGARRGGTVRSGR